MGEGAGRPRGEVTEVNSVTFARSSRTDPDDGDSGWNPEPPSPSSGEADAGAADASDVSGAGDAPDGGGGASGAAANPCGDFGPHHERSSLLAAAGRDRCDRREGHHSRRAGRLLSPCVTRGSLADA